MEKKKKNIIITSIIMAIWLCIMITVIILFSLIWRQPKDKDFNYGDFIYSVYSDRKGKAYVSLLTEEGKQKNTIVIPEKIEKYDVCLNNFYTLGVGGPSQPRCRFESKNLEKLILNGKISFFGGLDCFLDSPNFKKYILKYDDLKLLDSDAFRYKHDTIKTYIPYSYYKEEEEIGVKNYFSVFPANLEYYYNYDGSENQRLNGLYFLDDYDNEIISYRVTAPTRDGYEFGGWYKEPECINEWNFETDIVPKAVSEREVTREEYLSSFTETKLYAKWIKK